MQKALLWLLALAGLALPLPASSDGTWDPVHLCGGWVNDIAEDPDGRLLAAVAFGGIYRSADAGESWQQIYTGDLAFDPRCVATDTTGTIFVGSEGQNGVGFLRSTDQGVTWAVVNNSLASKLVIDLEVAPNAAIWACTYGSGLYQSTDGGTTFSATDALPASYPTFVKSGPAGVLFAGVQFATANLYRSTDEGATWEPSDTGISGDVLDVSDPTGDTMYATDGNAVYKSTDGGGSWTALGGASAGPGYRSVAALPGDLVYASHFAGVIAGGKVYRSADGGDDWEEDPGLSGYPVDRFYISSEPRLYLEGQGPGVLRRDDPAGWEQKSHGMFNVFISALAADEGAGRVYAGTRHIGVHVSTDAGTTWQRAGSGIPVYEGINALCVNVGGTVFGSGPYGGVYRSTDQGGTWDNVHFVPATAMACNEQGHVFAGYASQVWRSTDGGDSWTPGSLPTVQFVADLAALGNTVFAATGAPGGFGSKGVYRSTDGGATWAEYNNGLTDLDVTTIAVDPVAESPCRVTAGTKGSRIFDLDESQAWVQNLTVPAVDVVKVRKKSTRTVVEEGFLRAIFDEISCDWQERTRPARGALSDFLQYRPGGGGVAGGEPDAVAFAGTAGHGLWREAVASSGVGAGGAPADGLLRSLGQNPAGGPVRLGFDLVRPGFVRLQVFDARGAAVATLVEGWREAGRHEAAWSAAGVPSGVYFSRLFVDGAVRTRKLVVRH